MSGVIIVAGHLRVDPAMRASFLADAANTVRMARAATGCLDFHLSADPIEPDRVNVFELWSSKYTLGAFRGSGPSGLQAAQIRSAEVREYVVSE
jgi:quinol monooxygenase YgiN